MRLAPEVPEELMPLLPGQSSPPTDWEDSSVKTRMRRRINTYTPYARRISSPKGRTHLPSCEDQVRTQPIDKSGATSPMGSGLESA